MNTRMSLDGLASGYTFSTHKPLNHIERILLHLQPFSTEVIYPKGAVIRYTEENIRYCFLLYKGSVALHRRGDGMVLNSESTPFVFGISNQLSNEEHMYIRTLDECCVGQVPLALANEIIAKDDLWESLSHLVIYTTGRVYDHCMAITQMSAYDIIRFQLMELIGEPDNIRLHITAANYIIDRSYLSRSGTMRILSELRTGGYIIMDKGILIEIRHLPLKY